MSSVKTYNVQELLKSLSSNGSFGSSAQVLAISDAAWKGLSEEQRTIMTDCGHQVEASLAKRLDEVEAELKTEFAGMGIEVYEFTPEAWAPIAKRLHDVSTKFVAQMEERGLPAQQAFDEYKADLGE
jgi:TRAP-type C4-dicarboxylate transport system substrate-binding protein